MPECATYITRAKLKLGDRRMSDEQLGVELAELERRDEPFSQSAIAKSKHGKCPDSIAVALERVLDGEVAVGEILLVARAEREKDQVVKERLMTFAKNVVGRASQKAAAAFFGAAVMLGLIWPLPEARAKGLAEAVPSGRRRLRFA